MNKLWNKFVALLQLVRPANIITAHADILAGGAVALGSTAMAAATHGCEDGCGQFKALGLLLLSTTGLYGGGITLNDFFDARLDARERPERPIPSGRVSRAGAGVWGFVWLSVGMGAAFAVWPVSGAIAVAVAALAILYNAFTKHNALLGPLNMGLCRGGNLLLGVSLVPDQLPSFSWLALVPIVYIAIITFISRAEVSGGQRPTTTAAAVFMALFVGGLGCIAAVLTGLKIRPLLLVVPFLIFFAARVLPPFIRAARTPVGPNIGGAVRAGVLSLIILNSVLAAASGGPFAGLVVLLLWPVSMGLARIFAVT